ncbi:MAG: 50S ribosome-binding GTPase [Chromatiales bacterium]|jgi:hypothetical protein
MPTNVTADYKKAEAAFREAREPAEKLASLKEMLRTIPKHKGTEHLQADIKSRIKMLSDELAGPRKGGKRSGPAYVVRPEGAAQIALLGPPNAGKSTLHDKLCGSHSEQGPYPFTTHHPIPGMMPFEDIYFQLIDLPPITADYFESWMLNALQPADAAMLVVDVTDPDCVDQVQTILARLGDRKVVLSERWPGPVPEAFAVRSDATTAEPDDDPFMLELPTLLVGNKSDLDPEPAEVRILEELLGREFPALAVSALTGDGLEDIGKLLYPALEIVRVYTKVPGHAAEDDRPFTVRRGQTVADVARLVHKDIAAGLRFARMWGSEVFDGQQVGPDHTVADGDRVELHV